MTLIASTLRARRSMLVSLSSMAIVPISMLGACSSPQGGAGRPPAPVTQAGPAASAPPSRTPTPVGPDAKPAPVASTLTAERKYLNDWFGNTPVVIDLDRDGVLRVDVPLQHAFDAGKSLPRPALMKVIEHVGTSLRRVPTARFQVAAGSDAAKADAALADQRAIAVRDALVKRGVNAIRAGTAAALAPGAGVTIRITMPASAS